MAKREPALRDPKIHKILSNGILSDKSASNNSLRSFCFNLRNKALAGAFEVTNYAKGKEGTQFGDKINRMYPHGAECIFCGDPREDFYHILIKCPQLKEDRDNIKCKVSEILQTNVEELIVVTTQKSTHMNIAMKCKNSLDLYPNLSKIQ
jgi:hypothetical protein